MKEYQIHKGSRAWRILEVLLDGSKTHSEIGDLIGIEMDEQKLDYDSLKRKRLRGERKSPPRYTNKIRPGLSNTLARISRRHIDDPNSSTFVDLVKPLVVFKGNKWEITKWGRKALKKGEDNEKIKD